MKLSGTVEVFQRSVYGVVKVYPANYAATLLAQLAGAQTFNAKQLKQIRDMGLTIEQVADPSMQPVSA